MKKAICFLFIFFSFILISCGNNSKSGKDKFNINRSIPEEYNIQNDSYQYGEITEYEYYSDVIKSTKTYSVITPINYDSNKEYPLLLLFPTLESSDNEVIDEMKINIIYGNLCNEKKIKDVIILVVNHLMNKEETFKVGDMYKSDLSPKDTYYNVLPKVYDDYKINKKKIYLYGFSMGGRQAANYLLEYGGIKEAALIEPYFYNEDITVNYKEFDNIYLIRGIQDGVVFDSPAKLHNVFNKMHITHEYHEINMNHNFDTGMNMLYIFFVTALGV